MLLLGKTVHADHLLRITKLPKPDGPRALALGDAQEEARESCEWHTI